MDALRCLHSEMSSWALESTGCTKELQLPRNRSVWVWVWVWVGGVQMSVIERGRDVKSGRSVTNCVCSCMDVYYVE